jgi:hypothetical protein
MHLCYNSVELREGNNVIPVKVLHMSLKRCVCRPQQHIKSLLPEHIWSSIYPARCRHRKSPIQPGRWHTKSKRRVKNTYTGSEGNGWFSKNLQVSKNMGFEFYELWTRHRVGTALLLINAVMKSIVERKTRPHYVWTQWRLELTWDLINN